MKWLLLFTLISSSSVMAKPVHETYLEKKYYYSALNEFFFETYNKPITEKVVNQLEEILYFTGVEILEDYDEELLLKYPSSSIRFIVGRKYYNSGKNKKALKFLENIHPKHRYFPEAKMVEAQVYAKLGDKSKEEASVTKCVKSAGALEAAAANAKIGRYYKMIEEVCLINAARNSFTRGEYSQALTNYEKIPKTSYKWPYVILEKAWVHYQLKDYNRALGLLSTYKSPLLDTYFFPEAEYLTALAYFRLCLYDDSLVVLNQYYQAYRPRFTQLHNVLSKHKKSRSYFYDALVEDTEGAKSKDEFVKKIMTRLKKQIRFSLDSNTIYKINKELNTIHAKEPKEVQVELMPHLADVRENIKTKINYNAKKDIFDFLQTVPLYSAELFKLNLEIVSRKRDLLYKSSQLAADEKKRTRGELSNVKRSSKEHFWRFEGEFWADELGDYSLGLKSHCAEVKIEEKK